MPQIFDTPIFSNDASLDRVLTAGLPVLLVFTDGAAPLALNESLSRLAKEHAGKLLVVQIPTKDNPASTRRYNIQRTPTAVAYANGQVQSRAEAVTGPELEKHTLYLLGKGPKPEPAPASRPTPQGYNRSAAPAGFNQAQAAGPRQVTDATFDRDVMRSSQPVLVDFWAPWCGPCRMTEPILEKLARELSGRMQVAKVNVDENPISMQRYGVQGIPTMMIVKDGRIIDRWVGALPEGAIRSRVANVLR